MRVLMLNGGGNPSINYQSHLLHLQKLHELLLRAAVSTSDITVFASDGNDPAPDLATRDAQPEGDFWRLEGTRLEYKLRTPITTVDSKLPNVTLERASKANLTQWFDNAAKELHAGDTLLLYVTDHGTRPDTNPLNNRITLWGNDEWISVGELGDLMAKLDSGVRVVSLMSQCFSGGFAALGFLRTKDGEPTGNVCGYFSSTADRPAYGCFPENRGKENVGHSFEFFKALERTGKFSDAHEDVLVADATPDVPLRTSDIYLDTVLDTAAQKRGIPLDQYADELLGEAIRDSEKWQKDTKLLDRIAQATGSFSPRSLKELDELSKRLPEIDQQLTMVDNAWDEALSDGNVSNLERFLAGHATWNARLADPALAALDPGAMRTTTTALLGELSTYTAGDLSVEQRLTGLHRRGDDAEAASYRMQVRLAVVLRMRNILLSIAGRVELDHAGTGAQKAAFDGFRRCEDVSFPRLATPAASTTPVAATAVASYPPFEQDVKLTRDALPGWMGIRFKDPGEDVRTKQHLSEGASMVALVYPDSPALAAGLQAGDIVTGPPGKPFTTRNEIRQWTMLSEIGKASELEIVRDGKRKRIQIAPDPFPVKWPSLPGPVQVGALAPKVDLKGYRGPVATYVQRNKKRLLYFWATWCGPCKAALPELLAFEKKHKIPVVAITDEGPQALDKFVKTFGKPFPQAIAMDPLRQAFVAYGVSGTPTFVLIDEEGKVAAYQVGYSPRQGLALPGWTWSERANTASP
jgi:thiol-disulfide isomerase/thioredoxin